MRKINAPMHARSLDHLPLRQRGSHGNLWYMDEASPFTLAHFDPGLIIEIGRVTATAPRVVSPGATDLDVGTFGRGQAIDAFAEWVPDLVLRVLRHNHLHRKGSHLGRASAKSRGKSSVMFCHTMNAPQETSEDGRVMSLGVEK